MNNSEDTELVIRQDRGVAQVTMNRPQALNALSLEMIRIFSARLSEWANDAKIKAVFIDGAGGRAFCAGGDVKSTYKTGMAYRRGGTDDRVLSLFYGEEYCLNRQLFHCKKPLLAFMDGIVMGGGFGIAGPCKYRIATEKTLFAMPETQIGFFPDVGSMYFLTRCPGEAGAYLALTGSSIGPEDMLFCGLATHYIPSAQIGACREKLTVVGDNFDKALNSFHTAAGKAGSVVQQNLAVINECFTGDSVSRIIANLKGHGSPWAKEQAAIIETRSPSSLKVTLAHLRRAATMNFDEITAQDFILAQHFMQGHDFYEGVRAQLIDRDRSPKWDPARLEDVSGNMVLDYFVRTGMTLDELAAA